MLNSLDIQSYWSHKLDYYYTVIPNSSSQFSKINQLASDFYPFYTHPRHTTMYVQSTTLSHDQDTPKDMTAKIRIKVSCTAAQAYHFLWDLTMDCQ